MTIDFGSAVFKPAAVQAKSAAVPVDARLSLGDALGGIMVRCGFGRSRYRVAPGLYRLGNPSADDPVLVTANYKLSFDSLRKELAGISAWLLVLDTKGVNVWCAAGKGSFGTEELIRRVRAVGLSSVVSHRTLILPQLGAVGVSAHEAAKATGFRVAYGPVRARDLRAYLAGGMKKDEAMRRVRFDFADRMAVAPVELFHAWPALAASLLLALLLPAASRSFSLKAVVAHALFLSSPVFVGSLGFPALLPFLPFRPFALKGAALSIVWTVGLSAVRGLDPLSAAAFVFAGTSVASFISMNFTGSSTYTNLPGASKEVRIGLPLMAAALIVGAVLAAARYIPLMAGR